MSTPAIRSELCRLSAAEAVDLLQRGGVSPLGLVEAAAERIAASDGALNALPTLCLKRARDHARWIMSERHGVERSGAWLAGLPVAIEDLEDVAAVPTTYGSPIHADHVPDSSYILAERLGSRGAIAIGKSNTPEFGAGASTFNEVFGKTGNPRNLDKSVAGSPRGSVAAVAAGQVWLATGSDLGGSPRTPAGCNAVVGLRPSPGRVARGPVSLPFSTLSVAGPIARSSASSRSSGRWPGYAGRPPGASPRWRSWSRRPARTCPTPCRCSRPCGRRSTPPRSAGPSWRAALYRGVAAFFETYDLLLCPAAIVAPFDVGIRYVEEVEGRGFDDYMAWIGITFALTLTACPALSAPAGFPAEGLPVGLQILGPPRGEAQALAAAAS